jgi:aryl-alcohol dehydrogenase-like predicted oxidoreductase
MKKTETQIGLGTVQLGLPYGIHAQDPLMSEKEVNAILKRAVDSGIRFFDTATSYGEAENRLGKFGVTQVEVASKISAVSARVYNNEENYRRFVFQDVHESLKRLGIKQFKLLQFHQSSVDFLTTKHIEGIMRELVDSGICESIGVSVYHPEEAIAALQLKPVSAIQIPLNLFDRRFLAPQFRELYKKKSARIIARSVLWQGLLTSSSALPKVKKANVLEGFKEKAQQIAKEFSMPLEALALGYVFGEIPDISIGLVGVDSEKSLLENISQIKDFKKKKISGVDQAFEKLSRTAEEQGILNPQVWDLE